MKKIIIRRALFPVIVLLLVITTIVSGFAPIATQAAAAEETSRMSSGEAQAISNSLKLLRKKKFIEAELGRWAKEKAEIEKIDKETLKKLENVLNIVNKNTQSLIHTINDIGDGGDFDTATCISNVVDLASGILACAVPWGTVASTGIELLETIIKASLGGEPGPDANALMEDRLNQRLDEIADQISEVQDRLAEISNEINQSTEKIISSVSTALENETDKNHLRDFMLSSGKGDFSYNQFRNYIYGETVGNRNATTAYYGQLLEAQLNGGSSEDIKHYYDLLYASMMDNRTSFHDYIIGDGFGKSIVATYYDVLSARPDLTEELGMSAEMAAVQFAYDLYQTELMMDQLILACNNYQYTYMVAHDKDSYDYGTGKVLKSEILNKNDESEIAAELNDAIDDLREQFAKDLVYILDITGSYVVENGGQYDYLQTDVIDGIACLHVLSGQTVYLNRVPATLCERFDLSAESFDYSGRGVQDEDGIVRITNSNKNGTVNLTYNDNDGSEYALGTIKFVDASKAAFSGGDGTEDSPYLISTEEQFLNIANGMDKHYRLVKDLNFYGMETVPFGYGVNNVGTEVYREFTGVLDGNGFSISNLKINGQFHSGVFGKIGSGGIVKNLTVSGVNVDVNISYVGKSSATFTGGIIAGTNNGEIDSCTVSDCEVIVKSNTTNEKAERNVFFKYGGVVGSNSGSISAVVVEDSKVDVSSIHDFGGADTAKNQNNVFVGGICGVCTGTLQYAGVENDVVLNAYAKSVLNPQTTVNPYLKAIVGGITTNEGLDIENISNVYSLATDLSAAIDLDVESKWGKHYRNAKSEKGELIPGISEENITQLTAKPSDVQEAFWVSDVYDVIIEDKTTKYQVGETEIHAKNLEIMVNSQKVEKFQIVDYYGFTTYNDNFEHDLDDVEITLLFLAEIDEKSVLLTGTFPITVAPNYVTAIDLINYDTHYFKGETVQTVVTLEITDANGEIMTVDNETITVKDADSATVEIGKKTLEISYNGLTCQVEIEVLCNVHYSYLDYQNTEHYTFIESVTATCQHGGYDAYTCLGCGETIKTNRTGTVDHKKVRELSKPATCADPGEIGRIYCTYCDKVFEQAVELPRLSHNIVKNDNSENHYCTLCKKTYAHEFVVSQSLVNGVVTYTYTCDSCGYVGKKADTNIITNEERLRPTVIVGNGYALKPGDLVTVYVDLENNPGVNGANFGIRYDERLELVDWYEGDFFSGTTTEASHSVSCGYNFVWATEEMRSDEGGNLLKLVFRVPEDATSSDKYIVSVVYSTVANSEGGFSLPDKICAELGIPSGYPQKFIAKDGIIRLVERLPGDMNNDGVVNLLDALYLSNALVNEDEYSITPEILKYGDVNLVGGVNVDDVVKILQSISGGYGASLLSPEYYVQLNTNGFYEYQPDALFVQLYGENNTYVALAEIEQFMQQREGYKFLGWYTRLEGGKEIKAIDLVSYDADQKIQTLYAHWEKNSVSFDMNGATSGQLEKETYLGNGEQWIVLEKPEEKYDVIFTDPNNAYNRQIKTMFREFAYWEVEINGTKYKYNAGDAFPVHMANMGEVTLVAHWKEWSLDFPKLAKEGYHADSVTWYTNIHCTDALGDNVYETIKSLSDKVLYGEWTKPITYYVQYNGNGATSGTVENSAHDYDTEKQLNDNFYKREYTVTFNYGWDGQSNTVVNQSHEFEGWSETKNGPIITGMVKNWTDVDGKVITVYAIWDVKTVDLLIPNVRTGYQFMGWYEDAAYTKLAGNGVVGSSYYPNGECTLYAKWEKIVYAVTLNPNGGGGVEDKIYVTYNDRYDSIQKLPTPTRTGHKFIGWENSGTGEIVTDSTLVSVAMAHGLTAKWTAYTVTLDLQGGTNTSPYTPIINGEGKYYNLPTEEKYLQKTDHAFVGWYYGNTPIKNGEIANVSENVTLKAKWVRIRTDVVYSSASGHRNKSFDRGDSHTEWVYSGMDKTTLQHIGYNYLEITIVFDAQRKNPWSYNGAKLEIYTDHILYEAYWDIDDFSRTSWTDNITVTATLSFDQFDNSGSFYLIWFCRDWGGSKGDGWRLGQTEIIIKAVK